MTYTFPLTQADLADLLKVESVAWNPLRQQEYSGLGNGDFLVHDLAPMLWEGECTTIQMYHADAERIMARFNVLDGALQAFYMHNPAKAYPAGDPTGTLLSAANAAVTILAVGPDNKSIAFSGLPAWYMLTDGDLLAVDHGSPSRRALLQLVEGTAADGDGNTPLLEVRPHLRPGIVAGLPIQLSRPAAKVKVVPGTLRTETTGALTSRIRFTVRQTLQAG